MTTVRKVLNLRIAAANDCYWVGNLRFTSWNDLIDWLASNLPEID